MALSIGVIVIVLAGRLISKKAPGALIAIIIAIVVSRAADLAAHGVAVLGQVPRGLPHLAAPALGRHDAAVLLGTSTAMFVVILAQSAVTARTYAAAHEEAFSQNADLVGLGAANVAAAFSGTFVVNGSPTQTQVTDSAGGRSQLASLTAVAVVLIVLLLFTGTLTQLPIAALASVVFVIAVRLIDVTGMRRILAYSRAEFAVALLTTVAVVVMGVEDGIAVAVVISIINHLRHSYRPLNSVLLKSPTGHWKAVPVTPGARTEDGLVIYRFGTSLYYANASRLVDDITVLAGQGGPLRWLVLDFAAIGDVDYTAAGVLSRVTELLRKREVRFAGQQRPRPGPQASSTATASTPPSAPAPTTRRPARRSRPSTRPRRLRRDLGATAGPQSDQPISAISSSSWTTSPSATCSLVTVPLSSARMGISIFIDSRMTRVSPSSTWSPSETSTFHTFATISARTSATAVSSSPGRYWLGAYIRPDHACRIRPIRPVS